MRLIAAALALALTAGSASAFEISSPAIGADGTVPLKFTANAFGCHGSNISLPLKWSGVPAGAKSLALTMFDPDAPTGSGFWHWTIANMPPGTTGLAEGAGVAGNGKLPKGAMQGRNDAGTAAYFGPCPPKGDKAHRYVITLFAVDTDKLSVDKNTSGAVVGFQLHFHTIDKTSVTYHYGR